MLLTLEEKEVPYTTTLVDFDHKPQWLLDVNPAGSVPVMKVRAGGWRRTRWLKEALSQCDLEGRALSVPPFQTSTSRLPASSIACLPACMPPSLLAPHPRPPPAPPRSRWQDLASGEWVVDSGAIVDLLEQRYPQPPLGTSESSPQMCAARRASDCLPEPPTPMSIA